MRNLTRVAVTVSGFASVAAGIGLQWWLNQWWSCSTDYGMATCDDLLPVTPLIVMMTGLLLIVSGIYGPTEEVKQ